MPAPVATAWAEVTRIEARAGSRRAPSWRRPSATATISLISLSEIDALAPEAGEETRLAEERAAMQAGVKAGESLTGLDELLGGSDGALGAASAGGAADRARSRRSSAAGRGAGGARPGGDRGERGRGQDRSRRRRSGVRSGAARSGRGAAVRDSRRLPASIGSSPMRWPSLRDQMRAQLVARSRPAASGSPSSTANWSRRAFVIRSWRRR